MADLVGKYRQMAVDYKTHEALVTFSLKANLGALEEELKAYEEKELVIKISPYSPKRSLNANAYFHSLCSQIGKKVNRPQIWIKNKLIAEYGQPDPISESERAIIKTNVDLDKMWLLEAVHVRFIRVTIENEKEVYWYELMRPSHTYTVKEMSELIDGTVQEAKELGIPTITDAEMERILNAWGKG